MDKHYVRGLVLDPTMKVSPSRVRRQRDTRERDREREIFDASSPDVKLQDEQPIFQHNYDRIPGQPDVCACNAANCVRYRDGSDASAAAVWYGANHGHKL